MSEVTVRSLAKVLNLPVDKLLEQLAGAGMQFSGPDQVVSSTEKMKLLGYLRRTHGKEEKPAEEAGPSRITLQRRKVEEITVGGGKTKATVAVEVRQKRTYVKRAEMLSPVDAEREEAARKLAESQARSEVERKSLDDADRRRQEQAAAERPAKAKAEAPVPPPAATGTDAEAAPAAPVASENGAPARPVVLMPTRADAELAARAREAARGRGKGGREGEEEDRSAGRFVGGQLHLSEGGHARRTASSSKKKSSGGRSSRSDTRSSSSHNNAGSHAFSRPTTPVTREVAVGDAISVGDLANKLAMKGGEVVKALFKMGVMATLNQTIDHDTAVLVIEELGHKAVRATEDDAELALAAHIEADQGERSSRPPVVTIMGHVDHGKTSLLDHIRRTKVASGEAGGITQHIGAYHVQTGKGVITFLDTPGHSAFTAMRARGAKLTDLVVLVVAADDGVMPQTIEAIKHARAAKVPLVVAMNKMDKPNVNLDNLKNGLAQHGVTPEEWGGETPFVPVSAKTGLGIDALLDAILVQAEVMELAAPVDGKAAGTVIESSLDKGRGPVATVLVQQGTLSKGDYLVCGTQYGRVRALFDEAGKQVDSAGPSIPVVLLGLSGVPNSGDDFVVVADERLAKDVAQQREAKVREAKLVKQAGRMEDIMAQMGKGEGQQQLNLVIKADVQGSVEALRDSLVALSNDMIKINVVQSGVGGITESEAVLAAAAKAVVIGFNVRADAAARKVIENNGLDLRYFSIIYDVIDQVKQVASGLLGKEIREEIIGIAEVRDVFRSSKFGAVAGSLVIEGTVKKSKPIRVLRNQTVIFEGELESLRRFKDSVEEVRSGTECGIAVKAYNDVKPGDLIECFERIEVARSL
ncbi:translation initiation factor IF-2 [Silanimonas sp.]|uniref:translation initiation factor IF-2 n=1 Tax=Silanimonas sp. TaxID=1929290 RepID=UPI001BBD1D7F|nr:translation initiation factor IF-2 [Silanimonas sp.]MBS3895775.1 translation initiation factor IF-2 [Silanimonas sp.]MBS3924561.1 translation initiation factor IF-2 [Xanthomonadaceae bacterium]